MPGIYSVMMPLGGIFQKGPDTSFAETNIIILIVAASSSLRSSWDVALNSSNDVIPFASGGVHRH
ncbi:hypothetical protein J3P88_10550 [Pseudomonas sp. Z3-6]|uniref:hypothetical protein n=1 Tax=Pseudomonas sp. Z3-6 TaxID=2817411 RepID=UPI003DA8D0E8